MILALLLPQSAFAWDSTGHELVARIAWENMTPTTRQQAIALLRKAPQDACLLDLTHGGGTPSDPDRELFMLAATWPDVVRPRDEDDERPCIRFHRREFHFINFFWEGTSGGTGQNSPDDREDIPVPEPNAIEELKLFRPSVACGTPQCSTPAEERALMLAWMLHLVGDIHQPLHTSARVAQGGTEGDQGGNLFKLGTGRNARSLHSFWDGIVKNSDPQRAGERNLAYLDRLAAGIMTENPRASFSAQLQNIDFNAWALEGFATTKAQVYPSSLRRNRRPSDAYQQMAFNTSKKAIALGGYRLALLLNQMFGS